MTSKLGVENMETIGRMGLPTEAEMAAYVKEENEAQLSEQAEKEWEDKDFDDTEAQIEKEEADEELKGELKRERKKLVDEAGKRMKEKVAEINAMTAREELDDHPPFCDKPPTGAESFWACAKAEGAGLILTDFDHTAGDLYEINYPHCRRLFISTTGQLGINRYLSASNFRNRRGD